MNNALYFKRQIQLWGEETQTSLQAKSIAIIGSGGLGSSLAYALGSSGIGTIYLVDFDTIDVHNIHRQIAFKIGDEGLYKADVAKQVIENRYDGVNVIAHHEDFDTFASKKIVIDLLIDATDNLPTRAKINSFAKEMQIPWLYGSVEAWNGQVCFFENASFEVFKITDRKPAGIAAPIVMHIASLQANIALRYLAGLPVKKDMLYYLYFDDEGALQTQKFSLPTT